MQWLFFKLWGNCYRYQYLAIKDMYGQSARERKIVKQHRKVILITPQLGKSEPEVSSVSFTRKLKSRKVMWLAQLVSGRLILNDQSPSRFYKVTPVPHGNMHQGVGQILVVPKILTPDVTDLLHSPYELPGIWFKTSLGNALKGFSRCN